MNRYRYRLNGLGQEMRADSCGEQIILYAKLLVHDSRRRAGIKPRSPAARRALGVAAPRVALALRLRQKMHRPER
jgi:hypothetical protein